MAVYQLGFCSFSQLRIAPALGAVPSRGARRVLATGLAPGASFSLSDWSAPGALQIEEAEPAMGGQSAGITDESSFIAAASPFGPAGARVALAGRVEARSEGAEPRRVTLHLLQIGEEVAGMVGVALPEPGVTYHVQRITGRKPGIRLRDFRLPDTAAPFPDRLAAAAVLGLTGGTLVDTPQGPRPVEDLVPGDLVTTLANGSQPLRWRGTCPLSLAELRDRPELWPILIEAGTLGNARPLLVAPQHRLLISDWRAQVYFGEDQVLIAAMALENGQTIRRVRPADRVVYCHLLFDRHEVILTEGALSESFHPGEAGMGLLNPVQRQEVDGLFPHLPVGRRRSAFAIVKPAEARALRLPG